MKRSSPPQRKTGVRKRNPKRRKTEFARCYHSKERVAFVKSLPCWTCGAFGFTENAHLLGNDGAGRKGGYEEIGPLCGMRGTTLGCHQLYDRVPSSFAQMYRGFSPEFTAAETQRLWLEHVARSGYREDSAE